MPYIGKGIVSGNFVKLDSITTSATATYALTNGGAAFTPQSVNQMIVSLNGVIQAPTSAFTISGSNIVFDSALTSSDVIDFILVLGDVNDIGVPSDDSISAVKLKSSAVTAPKLADQSFEKGAYGSSSNPITYTVKVITKTAAHPYYGTGSSQGYEIDGVEAPVLKLNGSDAGKKYYYKFDQSDSSNSGHPLLFYLKADKTGAYTTNVTATGTPGSAGASTTIQVDEYTPNILYYQCSSHAHMGNHVNHISNQINTSGTLLKLPTADGTAGHFMKTDGSGVLSFAEAGGGKLLQYKISTDQTSRSQSGNFNSTLSNTMGNTITPTKVGSRIIAFTGTIRWYTYGAGTLSLQRDGSIVCSKSHSNSGYPDSNEEETCLFDEYTTTSTSQITYTINLQDTGSSSGSGQLSFGQKKGILHLIEVDA